MRIGAQTEAAASIDPAVSGADVAPACDILGLDAALRPTPAGIARRWGVRRLTQSGGAPSTAILGSRQALNKIQAQLEFSGEREAKPVLTPIFEHQCFDWDRRVAGIERLIESGRVDRLIVALPLPKGCDSEVMLSRMIDLAAPVRLVDTEIAHDERRTLCNSSFALGVQRFFKEIVDRAGAAFLLAVLSPLLLIVAALIKLTSPGPALFVQPRLGRHNLVIPVIKFRTMYVDRGDRHGGCRTLPNDPRVTPLGRILRRWSIDELPQLGNVLAGHMSLVGPRPHAVMMKAGERLYFEALPAYLARHAVKPGITGWAQVNRLSGQVDSLEGGRARLAYDLEYIENWTFWLDLRIFMMTPTVFFDRVNRY